MVRMVKITEMERNVDFIYSTSIDLCSATFIFLLRTVYNRTRSCANAERPSDGVRQAVGKGGVHGIF